MPILYEVLVRNHLVKGHVALVLENIDISTPERVKEHLCHIGLDSWLNIRIQQPYDEPLVISGCGEHIEGKWVITLDEDCLRGNEAGKALIEPEFPGQDP